MSVKSSDHPFRVALVSAPWPLFNRPSIQLGALKAHLRSQFPAGWVDVEAHHFYLQTAMRVGYRRYHAVSQRMWSAEAVFSALLHPERRSAAARLFASETAAKDAALSKQFDPIVDAAQQAAAEYLQATDWRRFGLVGFSMCLCQTTATLYLIGRIKRQRPSLPVVVGGVPCDEASIPAFLRAFPEIDAVVAGEGERPLEKIVAHLAAGGAMEDLPPSAGVVSRTAAGSAAPVSFCQVPDLDRLPVPDFDDYFRQLKSFGAEQAFFPTLPAEVSRGCWWRSSAGRNATSRSGCAFCNLNLQWAGYRSKSPRRAAAEIDALTSRYRVLSVALTDNLLPRREAPEIFDRIGSLQKDLSIFAEIRPTTSVEVLRTLRAAGVQEVQIGVEALSSRLLRKLNKGTSAIQNLETMKHCEALGIANRSNLILCFPGSDEEDVRQTLRTLAFAAFFRPLKTVRFWLGVESGVYRNPGRYGVQAVYNHPRYRALFPAQVTRTLRLPVQAYRGDRARQLRLWRPVEEKVRHWEADYEKLQRAGGGPILGFRDGREFLTIRQQRVGGDPLRHRLTGTSRRIYLHCSRHRPLAEIVRSFPTFSQGDIRSFLDAMVEKRLMFEENGRYLSLAVPEDRWNRQGARDAVAKK